MAVPVTTVYRNEGLNGCQALAKCKSHFVRGSVKKNDGECIYLRSGRGDHYHADSEYHTFVDDIAFKTYKSTRIDKILQLLELQRALKVNMKFAIVCIGSILTSTVYGLVPSIVREIVDLEVCCKNSNPTVDATWRLILCFYR